MTKTCITMQAALARPRQMTDFEKEVYASLQKSTDVYCSHYHIDRADRDDLAQDAALKAFGSILTYNPSISSVATWANTVVTRSAITAYDKRTRNGECLCSYDGSSRVREYLEAVVPADESYAADYGAIRNSNRELVWDAISSLSEDHQRVIRLVLEGKESKEIAEELGCSQKEAYRKTFLARRALRTQLERILRSDLAA